MAAPTGETFGAALGWQAGVIEDDHRSGKVSGEFGGRVEMPPRRLQVEGEAVPGEKAVAIAPARIVHRARRIAPRCIGRRRGSRLMADAADHRLCSLSCEHFTCVFAIEPGLRDQRARPPVPRRELGQPARLSYWVTRLPFRLD